MELQLIEALRLLAALHCPLLPLQVRLHPDRLQLVLEVAASLDAALAVAKVPELERLAEALGLGQAAHRDAIYLAVAWRARRAGDVRGALGLALELVSSGHPPAWELCVHLCRGIDKQPPAATAAPEEEEMGRLRQQSQVEGDLIVREHARQFIAEERAHHRQPDFVRWIGLLHPKNMSQERRVINNSEGIDTRIHQEGSADLTLVRRMPTRALQLESQPLEFPSKTDRGYP